MDRRFTIKDLEPAAPYLRKSREEREAEARGEAIDTLERHRKALYKLAADYGVTFSKKFEEVVSGDTLFHRPEALQMLKEIGEGKWKSIWCMDIHRLGRGDMEDQGFILKTFKNAGTKIVTPNKIYDLNDEMDEEYTEFEAFMGRKELKMITRRLQSGRVRSVTIDKNYLGARPPYGYLIETDGKTRTLVPHPEQAEVVKLIFDLYTEHGMGSNKIAKELNRQGKPTYTGKAWEASTVLFILKNEVYTGRLQWKKKEEKKSRTPGKKEDIRTRPREEWIDVEGKHKPLVSKEAFSKAQAILKGKYHVPYQIVNGITNPLAGIVKCDKCGASMVYRPYKNQRAHIICYNPACDNKSASFIFVEQAILDGLQKWLVDYKAEWEKHASTPKKKNNLISIKEKSIQNLRRELQELEQQKSRLHDFLERGIYDENTYLDRSVNIAERIKAANAAITEAELELKKELRHEHAHQEIIPKLEKVLSLYPKGDAKEKNDLLKSVLSSVAYRKEKHQKGNQFSILLHPRLLQINT
jgi:ssDNA-binding Zn-finger/Zn-ribbon topoisomerase 1